MDDAKRTLLVAALSTYADLLAKNEAQLDLEQGKGKGKASDDDVDLTVEIQNQIRLCGELTNSITDANSSEDIAQTLRPTGVASKPPKDECESWEGLENFGKNLADFYSSKTAPNQQTKPSFSTPQQSDVINNEPYTNPFTGLPVIPETGYEAGPSSRPPAPLREPTPLSSHSLSLPLKPSLEPSLKGPIRPPPKPAHLRATPILPPQPTSVASLPQKTPKAPATPPEYGPTHMGQLHHSLGNMSSTYLYRQPLMSPSSLFSWETSIQHSVEGAPRDGGYVLNSVHKNKYLRHIAELASKALKATGSTISIAQTPSVCQSKNLNPREIADMPAEPLAEPADYTLVSGNKTGQMSVNMLVELPAEPADYTLRGGNTIGHVSTRPLTGSPQWRTSQEGLPPAYNALSHTSRISSSASISSTAKSSIWTPALTVSSRDSISPPISAPTSSSPDPQHHSIWTAPTSIASSSSKLQKHSSWTPTSRTVTSPQRSVSPSPSPNIAPGVKEISAWSPSATPPSRRTGNPSLVSPAVSSGAELQKGCTGRRHTIGEASNRPVIFGTSVDDQVSADDQVFTDDQASTGDQAFVDGQLSADDQASADDQVSGNDQLSVDDQAPVDDQLSAGDQASTDDQVSGDDQLSVDDQASVDDQVSTDDQAFTDDQVFVDGQLSADDQASADDQVSGNDQLSVDDQAPVDDQLSAGDQASTDDQLSVDDQASVDDQVSADATFAKDLHPDDTNSMASERSSVSSLVSPSINPSLDQRTSYSQKPQPTTSPPLSLPGSNSPLEDYLAAGEALAKALQQKEYRDVQMERDQLLAYSVANGTAEDGDVELAYFVSRETATLIALADASPHCHGASTHVSFDPWGMDDETLQTQLHWLGARELERELRAKDAIDEASLSEAKRLQAEFDKEARDEEAWEDWKKSNIEECTACGDEQHREELARPCEHAYCDSCLQQGFKSALASKTPFNCCKKALSVGDCLGLTDEFTIEYEEMMLELSTPNPMYCCNAKCAGFLPPRVIVGDIGTCEKCRSQTCRYCRRWAHPGAFCKEDKETEAVKELAQKKGWKTCPGCNFLIERQSGCLHMICLKCHTAFCYRCSKPWKDCESTCPDG